MSIVAAIGHLPGKINMYDLETRMFPAGQRICHSLASILRPLLHSLPLPHPQATASVMPRRHKLRGGTKAPISQSNGRPSPNPPTPLTHEGELGWSESVPVTCQHGARVLSHLYLRGGIRLLLQWIFRAMTYLIIKKGRKKITS